MIRRAAAIVIVLTLHPALVRAQDGQITVSVPSADVYKGPSTVTPIVGHVSGGTALPVLRNLGSWVRVPWPDAPDGVGYVHVTMGRLSSGSAPSTTSTSRASTAPASPRQPARTTREQREQIVRRPAAAVTPEAHVFGVGGLVAPMTSIGATTRFWHDNRLGVQVGFTRDAMTSDTAAGRVTSYQFDPGIVYGLFDRVTDYVWFRPYVGSAVSVHHQTLTVASPIALEPTSDNGVGFRVFAGSEMTFASVPRFGLSADVGYRRTPAPFPGFEPSHLNLAIAGHWYIR